MPFLSRFLQKTRNNSNSKNDKNGLFEALTSLVFQNANSWTFFSLEMNFICFSGNLYRKKAIFLNVNFCRETVNRDMSWAEARPRGGELKNDTTNFQSLYLVILLNYVLDPFYIDQEAFVYENKGPRDSVSHVLFYGLLL